tara:strand:+ start:2420 stop:2857 length:438 start_codon:yes stop_codon:yes gene_type:complete
MSNSKRKAILEDIVTQLKSISSPKIGKVSTKPEDFARLARTAFPFVQVEITDETKEDIAIEWRLATMTVDITVHLDGKSKTEQVQQQLADIIEVIEEKLEVDRSRGKQAQLTELLSVGDIQETGYPTVSQTMSVGVQYTYIRGNT